MLLRYYPPNINKGKKISFESQGKKLEALYTDNDQEKLVIFLPGVSGRSCADVYDFMEDIAKKARYSLVRMDFSFQQYKDQESYTIKDCAKDVENLLQHLKKNDQHKLTHIAIVAKSFGALVAHFINIDIEKLVLIGPDITLKEESPEKILSVSLASLNLKDLFINKENLEDCLTLIIHGDEDEVINVSNSKNVCDAKQNYYLRILHGAKHSFFRPKDIKIISSEIESFL
jgi:pimeloyl-ACP methyl ester carboxylesterase